MFICETKIDLVIWLHYYVIFVKLCFRSSVWLHSNSFKLSSRSSNMATSCYFVKLISLATLYFTLNSIIQYFVFFDTI